MLSLIPTPFRIYAMLGLAALALLAGAWAYSSIYSRGYDAAALECQAKFEEMQEANDQAIAAAEKALRGDLAEMKLQKDRLENEIAKLDAEAAADPDAKSCGISPSSVRRLNAVK